MEAPEKKQPISKILFLVLALSCLTPLVSSPVALVLGIAFAICFGQMFEKHVHKYIHLLLQFSIVGLGFSLHLDEALHAGRTGFALTIASISSIAILGFILAKLFKIDRPLSYLISAGTAICGGSAIAAVSPIIKPNTKQISLALVIVFSLNSVALLIYPSIGHWLHLTQDQFGLWAAVAIHDTSSVVGAANKYGTEALKVATTVKLARALWIIPVSVITMFIFKRKGAKIKIPWFIGFFVLAIILNTYVPSLKAVDKYVINISKSGLNVTLFLIGSTLSLAALKTISWKPLVFAILLWFAISIGTLMYLLH